VTVRALTLRSEDSDDEEDNDRRRLSIIEDSEVQGDLDEWFPVHPTYEPDQLDQAEIAANAEASAPEAAAEARALAAAPPTVSETTRAAVAEVAAALARDEQEPPPTHDFEIDDDKPAASAVAKPPPHSPPKPWFWPSNPTTIERLVLPLLRGETADLTANQYEQHARLFIWYRRAEEVLFGFLERPSTSTAEGKLQNWELFRRLIVAAQQPYQYDSQRLHQLDNAVALTHVFILHERTNEWREPINIDDENWPLPETPWTAPTGFETDPAEPIRLQPVGAGAFVARCSRARMEYRIYDHPSRDVLEKKLGKAGAEQWRPKPWREWNVTRRTLAYSLNYVRKFRTNPGFQYCVQRQRSEKFRANWHQLVTNLAGHLPLIATFHQASAIDSLQLVSSHSSALLDRLINPERPLPPDPTIRHVRPDQPAETVEERDRRFNQARYQREQQVWRHGK
jgi:hypothetical protein